MSGFLQALKALHGTDQELLRIQESLAAARKAAEAAEAEALRARTALEEAKGHAKDLRAREGLKEMDLKDLEGQIASWTVKLNTTRDNKEYQGILHQIGTLKDRKSLLEEEILGLMDQEQDGKKHTSEEEQHLGELSRKAEAARASAEAEARKCEQGAQDLAERRAREAQAVVPDTLAYYERIRARRDGAAMASVVDAVCQGCYLGLTPNQANQLAVGRDLVKCLSCGRILFPADTAEV